MMIRNTQIPQQEIDERINQAKQQLFGYMSRYDVPVSSVKKMGELGMMVLKNKKLYPQFVQQARQLKIPGAEKLSSKPDFRQIGSVIALAKLLEN
jgi:hypothetical protein